MLLATTAGDERSPLLNQFSIAISALPWHNEDMMPKMNDLRISSKDITILDQGSLETREPDCDSDPAYESSSSGEGEGHSLRKWNAPQPLISDYPEDPSSKLNERILKKLLDFTMASDAPNEWGRLLVKWIITADPKLLKVIGAVESLFKCRILGETTEKNIRRVMHNSPWVNVNKELIEMLRDSAGAGFDKDGNQGLQWREMKLYTHLLNRLFDVDDLKIESSCGIEKRLKYLKPSSYHMITPCRSALVREQTEKFDYRTKSKEQVQAELESRIKESTWLKRNRRGPVSVLKHCIWDLVGEEPQSKDDDLATIIADFLWPISTIPTILTAEDVKLELGQVVEVFNKKEKVPTAWPLV
eukprot:TRINITY_DN33_c0_g1_i2.p1 TRINITY_DN33_c0_g1~~TRINITY_DN33_c0_g1_i2.p1  ORF type:complete len:358 (+),score=68.40 TRINITY_DN33_c0_g1_i2:866-1939(+)